MNDSIEAPRAASPAGSADAAPETAPADPSDAAAPRLLRTGWDSVVLVCGKCRKRGGGPKKSKAAAVLDRLRAGLRGMRPRPRIVVTGCLGPCPKKAITVARPGADGTTTRVWAIASAAQADAVCATLAATPGVGSSPGPD